MITHAPGSWRVGDINGFKASNITNGVDTVAVVHGIPTSWTFEDYTNLKTPPKHVRRGDWGPWWNDVVAAFATAHLISAAPDLYWSLQRVMEQIEDTGTVNQLTWEEARAAIVKANGLPPIPPTE